MKTRLAVIGTLAVSLITGLAAQGAEDVPKIAASANASNSNAIGYHRQITSKILGEDRLLQIRLPRNYDSKPNKRYPMLIQLDGEDAFLHVIDVVEQVVVLEEARGVPEMIVVGIPNSSKQSRGRDMLPPSSQYAPKDASPERFLRFIKEEVVPFVKANYRTTETRILVGQSTSGFFAWWALLQDPALFQGVIAISPSFADCWPVMADELKAHARDEALRGAYLHLARGGQGREQGVAESLAMFLPLSEPAKGLTIKTKVYAELGHVPYPALYDALKIMGNDFFPGQSAKK